MNIQRRSLKALSIAVVAGALLLPTAPANAASPAIQDRPGLIELVPAPRPMPFPDLDRIPRPDPRPLPCPIRKSPVICGIAPVDPPIPVPAPTPSPAMMTASVKDALPPMVPGPYNPIPGPGDTPLPHDWLAS